MSPPRPAVQLLLTGFALQPIRAHMPPGGPWVFAGRRVSPEREIRTGGSGCNVFLRAMIQRGLLKDESPWLQGVERLSMLDSIGVARCPVLLRDVNGSVADMPEFGAHMRELNPIPNGLREKWRQNDMVPLWETSNNIFAPSREEPRHWRWSVVKPVLLETAEITDPAIIERRVMQLVNTSVDVPGGDATAGLMNAALQALRAGESASPHRHSVNALRFVLEGEGAQTIVNGKPCRMNPGDLVLTPGWAWHEHRHVGGPVSIWLDVLDANLYRVLGHATFQGGPPNALPLLHYDGDYASANIVPLMPDATGAPVFRYPWEDVVRALEAAPVAADGSRRVRYINPLSGGACLPLIDCSVLQIEAGSTTTPFASAADTIVSVVEGEGRSVIAGREIAWSAKDTFTVPKHATASHAATAGQVRLFMASNEEVYRRLGLLPGR